MNTLQILWLLVGLGCFNIALAVVAYFGQEREQRYARHLRKYEREYFYPMPLLKVYLFVWAWELVIAGVLMAILGALFGFIYIYDNLGESKVCAEYGTGTAYDACMVGAI